jgi:chromosome segregation ATPase
MATATVVLSKSEQATQLRAEAAALQGELTKLREKLEPAQRKLGELQDRRKQLEQDAARGLQPKPGAVASLLTQLAEAELPVDGLTPVVAEKQSKLDTVRATLANLESEIAAEAQRVARTAQLETEYTECEAAYVGIAKRINAHRLQLMSGDYPEYGRLRTALDRKIIALEGSPDPEERQLVSRLRSLAATVDRELKDGSFLRPERELRRQGWEDEQAPWALSDVIPHLRPPRT